MRTQKKKYCLLTFDVEEWFQVHNLNGVISRADWENKKSSVIKNSKHILTILKKHNVKATFFVLGWVAERFPELIKNIYSDGHEIASHGYDHDLVYNMNYDTIREDIIKSKKILEDTSGSKIIGYRAPSFSVDDRLIEILKELSFQYDSSYNAFRLNNRYGDISMPDANDGDIIKFTNGLYEIPVSSLNMFGTNIPMGGGAYFRLLPLSIFTSLVRLKLKQDGLYNFYLHPWEFEPDQPRIKKIRFDYRLRHYTGLRQTSEKFEKLIKYLKRKNCEFLTIKDYIKVKSN
jgi:polysaccharide deacetylase family protein (PEP-CTERM system associated)